MRLRDMRRLVQTDLRDLQKLFEQEPEDCTGRASETYLKNHAHTAGSDLCRSLRLASLHLPGLVSYDSAGGGNWTERLPVRFKWLAAHVATSLTKTEGFPNPGPRKVVALPPGVLPRLSTIQPAVAVSMVPGGQNCMLQPND